MSDYFSLGDKVFKPMGYEYVGYIVAIFQKGDGQTRMVVESISDGSKGMLFIFNPNQLELFDK